MITEPIFQQIFNPLLNPFDVKISKSSGIETIYLLTTESGLKILTESGKFLSAENIFRKILTENNFLLSSEKNKILLEG